MNVLRAFLFMLLTSIIVFVALFSVLLAVVWIGSLFANILDQLGTFLVENHQHTSGQALLFTAIVFWIGIISFIGMPILMVYLSKKDKEKEDAKTQD